MRCSGAEIDAMYVIYTRYEYFYKPISFLLPND